MQIHLLEFLVIWMKYKLFQKHLYRPDQLMDFHAEVDLMTQRTDTRVCLFGVLFFIDPYLADQIPQTPNLGVLIGIFKPNVLDIET